MSNKIAKYSLGDRFKKGKKTLTIIGVFKSKEGKIMYCFSETSKELSEEEVSKLEKIK